MSIRGAEIMRTRSTPSRAGPRVSPRDMSPSTISTVGTLSRAAAFARSLTRTRTGSCRRTNSFTMKEPAVPVAPVSSFITVSPWVGVPEPKTFEAPKRSQPAGRTCTFIASSSTACSTPPPRAGLSSTTRPGSMASTCYAASCSAVCLRAMTRGRWGNGRIAVAFRREPKSAANGREPTRSGRFDRTHIVGLGSCIRGSIPNPHDANASFEPGCAHDQKQSCLDDDGPGGSRDALTGRSETFDGDGCRHDSHRAKIYDPDDQEDRHETDTAVGAVEAEEQAVSPGRAGVGRQRTPAPGCLPAPGKVTRLPRGELEEAGDQDDRTDRDGYGARQRRLLHLDRRQSDAQRKGGHSEHGPHEEVRHADQRGHPTEPRLACPANGLAVAPQHWHQGWQHHRHHHHDPHAE